MKRSPSLLEGLIVALVIGLLVIGVILLVAYEYLKINNRPTATPAARETTMSEIISPAPATPEPAAITEKPQESPSPTLCPRPEGWEPYEMKTGDSLEGLAGERLSDLAEIMTGNCLSRPGAMPGTVIYLPPPPPTLTPTITPTPTISPTPTITLRVCDFPRGWVRYTLKSGDSLFKLGVMFQTNEVDLVTGNCLTFGTALHAGDILMVPALQTATVTPGL